MTDEAYTFSQAKARLDEIVGQVRKKDVSLEASLDLLEEGVRLANQCTELIDSADWDRISQAAEEMRDAQSLATAVTAVGAVGADEDVDLVDSATTSVVARESATGVDAADEGDNEPASAADSDGIDS